MDCNVVLITPEMATKALDNNHVNRSLSKPRVKQYASDMLSGKWQQNGEAIKFYSDGSLCDGQHRLSAIAKAGVPIEMLVITGLPKTITVQDRGKNRTVTDSMILEGEDRAIANNTFVATAKLHIVIQKGDRNISDGQVKDFIKRNKEMLTVLSGIFSNTCGGSVGMLNTKVAPIILACFYAVTSGEVTLDTIKEFISVLRTGMPTSLHQNAAIVLRNDIFGEAVSWRSTSDRIKAVAQVEKSLFDFNAGYNRRQTYANWNTPIFSKSKKCVGV